MIWGKTIHEKFTRIYSVCQWFSWYPVQLKDGRWVWWEYVWKHSWTKHSLGGRGWHYEPIN